MALLPTGGTNQKPPKKRKKVKPNAGGTTKKPKPAKTTKTTTTTSTPPTQVFDATPIDVNSPAQATQDEPDQASTTVDGPGVYSTGTGDAPTYHWHRTTTYHHQIAQDLTAGGSDQQA